MVAELGTDNFRSQEIPDKPQARAALMFYVHVVLYVLNVKEKGLIKVCKYASSGKWISLHLASLSTGYLLKNIVATLRWLLLCRRR